jgi:hypothetical protein
MSYYGFKRVLRVKFGANIHGIPATQAPLFCRQKNKGPMEAVWPKDWRQGRSGPMSFEVPLCVLCSFKPPHLDQC